jgi:hypothetical protein
VHFEALIMMLEQTICTTDLPAQNGLELCIEKHG